MQKRLRADTCLCRFCIVECGGCEGFSRPPCKTVPKITVSLSERDHLSLKLLSIVENKNIGNILIEAVRDHIKLKGADRLKVNPGED